MKPLDIRVLGDPVLRKETTQVAEVSDELRELIESMFHTMYLAEGLGLAAPQVGRSERIAVVDVEGTRLVLINPEIVQHSGSASGEEGCLSIPGIFGNVTRASSVRVRAMNETGLTYEMEADDLLARAIQHEIDHLHGRLFIDYLSVLKRRAANAQWETLKADYPGFIRRVALEPKGPHHSEGEL